MRLQRGRVAGSSISTWYEHRWGIPWYLAPLPLPLHRCRKWSAGKPYTNTPTVIERCRCGAWRYEFTRRWYQKNCRWVEVFTGRPVERVTTL